MWREGSFTTAAAWEEKKNPDVSTGTRTIIITVRLNGLSSKGTPHCLFLPIPFVFIEPCCQQGWAADPAETSPREIEIAFCGSSCLGWLKMMEPAKSDCFLKTIPVLQG